MGCTQSTVKATDLSITPVDEQKTIVINVQTHVTEKTSDNNNKLQLPDINSTNDTANYIIITDQYGSAQSLNRIHSIPSTSNNNNSGNINNNDTISELHSISKSKSSKLFSGSAALGLASQYRPTVNKSMQPSNQHIRSNSTRPASNILESPKSAHKSLIQSVRNVFTREVSHTSHKIVHEPKSSSDYESMCLSCYNCEQFNVAYACESCKPDENDTLPLLCRACNVGMHQFGKTSLHVRRVLTCHTADIQCSSVTNHKNILTTGYNQLLCYNCDEPYPSIYCIQCNQFMCSECQHDIHQPQKMKLHTRLAVALHLRYVHSSTTQHIQSTLKLMKSVKFNKQPMIQPSNLILQSPHKLSSTHSTKPSIDNNNNNNSNKFKAKKLSNKPSISISKSNIKSINNQSYTATIERRKPRYRLIKQSNTTSDIQPIRNHALIDGNVYVFSDPTCTDKLNEVQYEYRNNINPYDKQGIVDIARIACGATHSAAISTLGSLYMWGNNMEYQIGSAADGHKYCDEPVPIEFERHNPVKQISCGYNHNIALCHDNCVYTWGSGLMGVLGTGSDEDKLIPTRVQLSHYTVYDEDSTEDMRIDSSGDEQVVYVAAGQYNTGCVIRNRTDNHQLYMWGEGASGQLGNGKCAPSLYPTLITVDKTQVIVGISIGSKHCGVWCESGDVYTWGSNTFGQLGYILAGKSIDDLSGAANCQLTPRRVAQLRVMNIKVISVHCGERHTSVLTSTGDVYSFGSGETHQLGIFDNMDSVVPVKAQLSHKVKQLSVGSSITLCITEHGECYGWGYSLDTPVPKILTGLHGKFLQQCCVGANDTVCVLSGCNNDIYEWQYDGGALDGNMCDGTQVIQSPVINKALRGKRITTFSAGKSHYGAVTSDGRLYTWGDNNDYQLGLPSTANIQYMPVPVEIKLKHTVIDIQCSVDHTLCLTSDGLVLSWGIGQDGKLGHQKSTDIYEPKLIDYFVQNKISISSISVGPCNSACISTHGQLYVWGSNTKGQCCTNDYTPQLKPARCKLLSNESVRKVTFGYQHCVIWCTNDKLYTCGDNAFGQLGMNDDTESICAPIEIKSINHSNRSSTIKDIVCGDNISGILYSDGTLYMCGSGETKQMCQCVDTANDTYCNELEDIRSFTCVQLPFMSSMEYIQSIHMYGIDCCCMTSTGAIYTWGWNFSQDNVCTKLDYYPDSINGTPDKHNDQIFHKVVLGGGRMLLQS